MCDADLVGRVVPRGGTEGVVHSLVRCAHTKLHIKARMIFRGGQRIPPPLTRLPEADYTG